MYKWGIVVKPSKITIPLKRPRRIVLIKNVEE
jgi:hypothetical protein